LVDRKKLLCVINVWLSAAAAGLAVFGWLHLLNPGLILISVFLLGVGFAFNAPAWISMAPQIVSDAELPAAVTLSGLQLNISGIIGPALGGLVIFLMGPNFVFAVNAACFFVVTLAIVHWKRATEQVKLPRESFFESFLTAIRYVRYAPGLQIILERNVLFALFISVIPALMPVVGLKALHLGPCQLGLLFTSMGAGSVAAAAFIIPWLSRPAINQLYRNAESRSREMVRCRLPWILRLIALERDNS
jgi:MFS family permease